MSALARPARLLALWLVVFAAPAQGGGLVVAGHDAAEIRMPASALVEDYSNAGYSLRVEDGVARVAVDLAPVASQAPFVPPMRDATGRTAIEHLASSLTVGATTEFEAASRILAWMSRQISYDLDRSLSQSATAVLDRRRAYCTGMARLAVALIEAIGLPAREVAGYVAASRPSVEPRYHRWVEIRFSDRGWVFSDPLATHHYVPSTYVRLASERLLPDPGDDVATVLERARRRRVVDVASSVAEGIEVRRNDGRQSAASLGVTVGGGGDGHAVLRGRGSERRGSLQHGRVDFVDLEPGRYLLTVFVDGRSPRRHRIVFRDRIRAEVSLR